MEKTELLANLESRVPLYKTFPIVDPHHKKIQGTESEYSVAHTLTDDVPLIVTSRLPEMLPNGGEFYEDLGHLEYASPETSNPVSAVAYYEAGKVLAWMGQYSPELHCNNTDWHDNSFGAHESYFTNAPRDEWPRLIPFLIARTLLCGSGWVNNNDIVEASQRAHSITSAENNCTTGNRPVVNMRDEPLAKVAGFKRLHLICADANMSEVGSFLRFGTISLVLQMLELGALPEISYNKKYAGADIQRVSLYKQRSWLQGITSGPREVLELLSLYLDRAKELFSHRGEITDALLIIWEDTLEKLGKDPMLLWRRLDWVCKLKILLIFGKQQKHPRRFLEDWKAQDLAYHDLNPAVGLYYHLIQQGEMERIVSNELIIRAMNEPPADTRAYARGKVVQLLEERGGHQVLCANSWDHLSVVDAAARGYQRVPLVQRPRHYISLAMDDPRETYDWLVEKIKIELV